VVITGTGQFFTAEKNVYVFYRNTSTRNYQLQRQFHIECNGRTILAFIAGDYGNEVVGVCTSTGKIELWTVAHISAFAFDLEGQQKREIILPYDALNKSLSNNKREFKYLQIMVCGEFVLLQHNCYIKWLASATRKGRTSVRRRLLYRLKPQGFSIMLEYVRQFPLHDYDRTDLEESVFENHRGQDETEDYFADMRRDFDRIRQCDGENTELYALYPSRRLGRGLIWEYSSLTGGYTKKRILVTNKIPFVTRKQITQFPNGDFHLLLGKSFLAFSKFHRKSDRHGSPVNNFKDNIIFILKTMTPVLCGDKPKRNTNYQLRFHLRIAGDYYVFLDRDDQLVAWPRKRRGRSPPMAKVFI
jgi:hypothetical protein